MSDDIWKAACEDRRDAELSRLRTENEALRKQIAELADLDRVAEFEASIERRDIELSALRKRVGELQEDVLVEEIETLRKRVEELEDDR